MWFIRYLAISVTVTWYGSLTDETDGSQTLFYQVWAEYGATRIGPALTASSAGECAVRTRDTYPSAQSFMFNRLTYVCIPGGSLDKSADPSSDAEGSLFVSLSPPSNIKVMTHGNVTACIGFFHEQVVYSEAHRLCQSMGYFLVSVKSLQKLDLLRVLVGKGNVWVGCDDTVEEGEFRWMEDDSVVSSNNIKTVFGLREPNNHGDQDCCAYKYEDTMLDDDFCSSVKPFVCEVSLDKCM